MTRPPSPRSDAHARTPSSAMLVQLLFVIGAVGTGATAALVTWLGAPAKQPPKPRAPSDREEPEP
ncbi:MAG: hypothetical protein U0234_21820 [Sandaracinus sp.]